MHLKLFQEKQFKETAEATGDYIGNKSADKIRRFSKISPWNNSKTNEEEMLREKYISPEIRQKIIDDLILTEKQLKDKN